MRTWGCACGSAVALMGPPEMRDGQILAHVRSPRHVAWSGTQTPGTPITIMRPGIYEERLEPMPLRHRVAS